MTRWRPLALAAATLLVGVIVPAPASTAAGTVVDAISWNVDDATKTITATVRLTIGADCGPLRMEVRDSVPALRSQCHVTPEIAAAIKQEILAVWKGHTYRCYDVVFDVDIQVDDRPTPTTTGDRLFVRIDRSAVNAWNWVSSVGRDLPWNSNDPAARLLPVNQAEGGSTWGYPAGQPGDHVYAHEFGHVLGLHEGYETVTGPDGKPMNRERADGPTDVMSNERNANVDPATIARVVERSVDPSKIKCDYKIDTTIEWFHFESLKCGGAEGLWSIAVSGVRDIGGARLVLTGSGTVTLVKDHDTFTGPWNAHFRIDLEGVPVSVGGQAGSITGDGELAGGVMNLVGTNATGNFWSKNPYSALSGPADTLKSFKLPVLNDRFC